MSNELLTRQQIAKRDAETGEVIGAAAQLAELRAAVARACDELETAAQLRVGAMDSQSRAEEISSQITRTVAGCVAGLRGLLG